MISIRPHSHAEEHRGAHDEPASRQPVMSVRHTYPHDDSYPAIWGRVVDRASRHGAPADPPDAGTHRAPKHAGLLVGLLVAAVTWTWVALVDAVLGEPFRTAAVLGGVAAFTTAHLLLCLVFGSALAALMDGAIEEPGLVLSVVFGVLLLEVAFAMLTIFISMTSLGGTAWLRIFVGSLVGTGAAFALLSRWYPAARLLRDAQADH